MSVAPDNSVVLSAELSALAPSADVSIRVIWSPARFVADILGPEVVEALLARFGLSMREVETSSRWISAEQLAGFLGAVREAVGSEEGYRRACVHRLEEAYGGKRFVLMATTPATTIRIAATAFRIVCSMAQMQVLEEGSNRVRLRYTNMRCAHLETREMCISRTTQTSSLPTLFGLPPAELLEHACIARGDDCCEYEFRFFTRSHWLPAALGLIAGVAISLLVAKTMLAATLVWLTLPLLGALAGALWEFRRTYRSNLNHAEEIRAALGEVAQHEAEARSEILELHRRQKEWGKHLEEEVAGRTTTMQQVVDRLKALGERRIVNLRGFSHDLRNPLAVVMSSIAYLRTEIPDTPDCHEALDDCETSVRSMEKLLAELVATVQSDRSVVRMAPEDIDVAPLVEKLRRRMRALVFGRDIRVSVFKTREAPERIHLDPLIFERVIDNLFTNAAKYTERGSIVVELDGKPGFLTLKVSDTGRGIAEDDIARIFQPEGSAADRRSHNSLGIGLSVVVRLLKQIGGRLEVMSKPAQGTTFWAHFPVHLHGYSPTKSAAPPRDDEVVSDVVTIRRAS